MLNSADYELWHDLVAAIHASGRQLVVAVTGGGSGAISALVQTPGASQTVLEAVVPYSLAALVDWIGGMPDQACSEATARAMAMAALERARVLAPGADPARLVGVSLTGSLSTSREKKGQRRFHLAAQTAARTEVWSQILHTEEITEFFNERPQLARDWDESRSAAALLGLIARAVDAQIEFPDEASDLRRVRAEDAPPEQIELLLGSRRIAVVQPGTVNEYVGEQPLPIGKAVFPGAFNPPHEAHLRMAAIAEQRLGGPVTWEASIINVDKPPLDFLAIRDRVEALREVSPSQPIALTRAATFREKAELFPGATFVVGADTLARIADPRYYGGDAKRRVEAVAHIAAQGCRFLAFGRAAGGRFQALADLDLPPALRALCDEVPAADFRADISSTELRAGTAKS